MEEYEGVTHYTFHRMLLHLFMEMIEFGVCINLFHWMAPLFWFVLWEDVQNCTGCDAMYMPKLPVMPWSCQGSCKSALLATPIPTLPPPRKKFKTIKLFPHNYLQVKHFLLKQMGNCQGNRGNCSPRSHPWSMLLILIMPANRYKFKQCPM